MVLYQVSDDYIGVHQPSLCAHRMLARSRAAFAAASRISPKLIFLPFLLASAPFSDRVPGCTRIVAWSPSTIYWSLSPGLIWSALRIVPGIVVCPFLVTVEWGMNHSLLYTCSLHFNYALPSHSLARNAGGQVPGDRREVSPTLKVSNHHGQTASALCRGRASARLLSRYSRSPFQYLLPRFAIRVMSLIQDRALD